MNALKDSFPPPGSDDGDLSSVLPRSPCQLAEVAKVILKTNKSGKVSDDDIKTLIHQANVRRQAGDRECSE